MIYPVFVTNQEDEKTEISSMPGNYRYGFKRVVEELRPLITQEGSHLRSIILFGVLESSEKAEDERTIDEVINNSPVIPALQNLKKEFPELLLCVDICLCGYLHSGHCGIMKTTGEIQLEKTQNALATMSHQYAIAGADLICPSDMMDGRIYYIRERLLKNEIFLPILSYSTKFQSSFYGPFRDAAQSAPSFGDRSTYQLPPPGRELGIRAALRDIEEGADFVMVKPAMPYLDLIRDLKNIVNVPIACYHTSGEFAMIYHASRAGALDLKKAVLEAITSFQRAGATMIITYFTPQILEWLNQ